MRYVLVAPNVTVSVTGMLFNDHNKNGKFDKGDGYAKNVRVYLDADNDGRYDAGEKTAVTDAKGKYRFDNVPAGKNVVRRR